MFRTLILVALTFVGCSMIKPSKVVMKEIASRNQSNVNTVGVQIITNGNELKEFWNVAYPYSNGVGIPEVDFENENLVVVNAGRKSSGGFKIVLNNYVVEKNSVHLDVQIESPSGPATMAITTPFKMYSVPKKITSVTANFNR